MYSGRIIDAHIHLWDPRTTPRTVTPLVKALGWSRPVLKRVVDTVVPSTSMAFVGTPDHVLSPYLPGMWWNETDGAAVDGFVHIQADWQSADPLGQVEETRWLESLCGRDLLAVVGRADLAHARLDAVLDAHVEASPRFRGIRDYLAHGGEDAGLMSFASSPDRTAEHAWRRGYDRLGERGLTFDAWTYADQLPRFERLVADHPDTPVVLCHLGSPVGAGGPFAGHVLQTVGPQRCMIASNFPMDRVSLPWTTLFEAFTRLTAGLPEQHRHAVFHGTAARFYACEGMTA